MRGDEADEANGADKADDGRGHDGDDDQHAHSERGEVHPHAGGARFAEAQGGELPDVGKEQQDADEGDGGGDGEGLPFGFAEGAEEPEEDFLRFFRGGDVLHQRGGGLEDEEQRDANQHQGG